MDYKIKEETLSGIADAIRSKSGSSEAIKVSEFAEQIETISTGSDIDLIEDLPIAVDFSQGNQFVEAPEGQAVKSAVIQKPENLKAENIAEGINIAGITGTLEPFNVEILENIPINLDFSNGNQTIEAEEGYLVKSATVFKPENLVPENIAEGINIAGIVGSLVSENPSENPTENPTVLRKKISSVKAGDVIFSAEELATIGFTISANSFLIAFPAGKIYAGKSMSGKLVLAMVLANANIMYSGKGGGALDYSGFVISTVYGVNGYTITQTPTFNGIIVSNKLDIAKSDLPYYDSTDGTIKFTGGGAYCFEKGSGSAAYIFIVGNWP